MNVAPPKSSSTLNAQLAQEKRKHLAFSCYCAACDVNGEQTASGVTPAPASPAGQ